MQECINFESLQLWHKRTHIHTQQSTKLATRPTSNQQSKKNAVQGGLPHGPSLEQILADPEDLTTSSDVGLRTSDFVEMAWRPLFTSDQLLRYRTEPRVHPQGAGRGGLPCPDTLCDLATWTNYSSVFDTNHA